MKKVLALVLAVMMMATVAFAVAPDVTNPFGTVTNDPAGVKPGSTLKITDEQIHAQNPSFKWLDSSSDPYVENTSDKLLKRINSDNYRVNSVKYEEGKSLVKSIGFNDAENRLEIKLVEDFSTTSAKKLSMTFTLVGKKTGKSKKPDNIEVKVVQTINYYLDETTATFASSDDTIKLNTLTEVAGTPGMEKSIYKIKATGTDKYTDLELETADTDVEVEGRVYDGDKLYLYNEVDADKDVLKKYADTDAEITFLTFTGTPTFNSTMTMRIYKEEGTYFYVNTGDGNLVDINGKGAGGALDTTSKVRWDEDEGCYILKTRTLGAYAFSDKKLNVSAASATNPDTGANDVVGVATALAAVALVSAAAVSLKK